MIHTNDTKKIVFYKLSKKWKNKNDMNMQTKRFADATFNVKLADIVCLKCFVIMKTTKQKTSEKKLRKDLFHKQEKCQKKHFDVFDYELKTQISFFVNEILIHCQTFTNKMKSDMNTIKRINLGARFLVRSSLLCECYQT